MQKSSEKDEGCLCLYYSEEWREKNVTIVLFDKIIYHSTLMRRIVGSITNLGCLGITTQGCLGLVCLKIFQESCLWHSKVRVRPLPNSLSVYGHTDTESSGRTEEFLALPLVIAGFSDGFGAWTVTAAIANPRFTCFQAKHALHMTSNMTFCIFLPHTS